MTDDLDLTEYVGRDNSIKADPISRKPPARDVNVPPPSSETEVEPVDAELGEVVSTDTTYVATAEPLAPDVHRPVSVQREPEPEPETLFPFHAFDHLGKINRNPEASEVAKMAPVQKTIYFEMLSSLEKTEAAETIFYEAKKAVGRATTAVKVAQKAYEAVVGKRTFMDEWRVTVAKLPEKVITDEQKQTIADALVEVEKAETFLAKCEHTSDAASKEQTSTRREYAAAAFAWAKVDGIPKDVASLVRARSETERAISMKNISEGRAFNDDGSAQVSTVGPSPYDRQRKAMPRTHPLNPGRHVIRGATIKPPSVR
jgi:hypothetical protein